MHLKTNRICALRSICFVFVGAVLGWGCGSQGDRAIDRLLTLPPWFEHARALSVGGTLDVTPANEDEALTLRALGFVDSGQQSYRKAIDLLTQSPLVEFNSLTFPGVNAIAVISIDRSQGVEQYIYPTLRSLFEELPVEAIVNVFVGSANSNYVDRQTLEREIGATSTARVHVVLPPAGVIDHFNRYDYSLKARATWNYARSLRSYTGGQHVMVLEDDVVFAKNAVAQLRPCLAAMPSQMVSLFNAKCSRKAASWKISTSSLQVEMRPIDRNEEFPTIQGMLFSAAVAADAGEYLAVRASRESHDFMLGRYASGMTGGLSLFYPSVVQHIGLQTTGLSAVNYLPVSRCFEPELAGAPGPSKGGY